MNMRKIYRQIAKEHGVTVAEVKRDMQVPHREETPTPEEVIRYASAKEKKEQSNQ